MTSFPEASHRTEAGIGFAGALIVVLLLLFTWISLHVARQPPAFDGAMNLQIAYSLSEGEGYRRTYGDKPPFPREIQTNAPYTVPAAAVFKLFGVGTWQAQLVNILYLSGLLLACMALLRARFRSLLAGALCAFMVLLTPGLLDSGFHGYGEIPALFWILLSALFFPWEKPSTLHVAIAGACLGLAVSTKTALLICFAAFGFCYVVSIASNRDVPVLSRLRLLAVLAVTSVLPLALVEVWRLSSLGGMDAYKAWWMVESNAIGRQAGTTAGYQDTESTLGKLQVHLSLLSRMYGLNQPLLAGWIAFPPCSRRSGRPRPGAGGRTASCFVPCSRPPSISPGGCW